MPHSHNISFVLSGKISSKKKMNYLIHPHKMIRKHKRPRNTLYSKELINAPHNTTQYLLQNSPDYEVMTSNFDPYNNGSMIGKFYFQLKNLLI